MPEACHLPLDNPLLLRTRFGCAGMATKLLDRLAMRRDAGFATPKQIRCLEKYGLKHVGEMAFEDANRMITRIAANGWRLPADLKQEPAA